MIHRLRDLDRRGRIAAGVLALLLVLIPLVAAAANHGRWEPQGDDALIELRARDVATVRNPLVGQPSTSGTYGTDTANVAHPGPLGFVVLAPGARLFGEVWGILLSTAAVAAASLSASASAGCTKRLSARSATFSPAVTATAITEMSSAAC